MFRFWLCSVTVLVVVGVVSAWFTGFCLRRETHRQSAAEAVFDGPVITPPKVELGKSFTPKLIKEIHRQDKVLRRAALDVISRVPNEPKIVVPVLVDALKDEDDEVRNKAAEYLREIHEEAAPLKDLDPQNDRVPQGGEQMRARRRYVAMEGVYAKVESPWELFCKWVLSWFVP